MLELQNICKSYKIGDITTKALDDISISFREKEFVAILGASGSGKTTFLNIIGGLDRYDSGDLIIKEKRTKDFKESDWDAYRNNSIGFVFQSYNLISHLTIVDNVEIAMTLSGVSREAKHARALEVLTQVGLKNHLHKRPNQLSGGEMQRVAIARALANNPEILLCDEPTGALDSVTSTQILELIKEVAKDRLIIMVTHNADLADQYADRIVRFKDGKIISDTIPYHPVNTGLAFKLKKTSMNFITALKISFNNIRTKKGRTFLTAFASSIGIIGIALILSLSNGFKLQIDKFQSAALSEFPIIISRAASNINEEDLRAQQQQNQAILTGDIEYVESDEVYLTDPEAETIMHENLLTDEYINYLKAIDPEVCDSIGYTRIVNFNMLADIDNSIQPVYFTTGIKMSASTDSAGMMMPTGMTSSGDVGLVSYPETLTEGAPSYLEENYDVLFGNYPQDITDIVLIIDNENSLDYKILQNLGFETDNVGSIKFSDIVGKQFKIISNNDYYIKTNLGNYIPGTDYQGMFDSEESITLTVSGIVRLKKDVSFGVLGTGVAYSDRLATMVIEKQEASDIVVAQKDSSMNVISMTELSDIEKDNFLAYLGGDATPYLILLYPTDFEKKDALLDYLDQYNVGKSEEEVIMYVDLADTISSLTGNIMDGITLVLIAFASISLVVSLIMIAIITYTSVLERTKEIGILKALGARKKDITRVFDAETCLLGVFSGTLGVFIAWILTFPANAILHSNTGLKDVAQLEFSHVIMLVIISTILTMAGGHIPARIAAKKDAVEALRVE